MSLNTWELKSRCKLNFVIFQDVFKNWNLEFIITKPLNFKIASHHHTLPLTWIFPSIADWLRRFFLFMALPIFFCTFQSIQEFAFRALRIMQRNVQSDKLVSALKINKILTFFEGLKKVFYFRREKSRISQSTQIMKLISGEKWRNIQRNCVTLEKKSLLVNNLSALSSSINRFALIHMVCDVSEHFEEFFWPSRVLIAP